MHQPCRLTNPSNRILLMAKYFQQCFCLWWQNRHCLVKFWKCEKAESILPHDAKTLLELFCLQLIIFGYRQNSSSSALLYEAKQNTWFCMGRSGLDRTDDFQKFCGSRLDRI